MLRKIPSTRLRLIERIVTRAEAIVSRSRGKRLKGLLVKGRARRGFERDSS